jgi:hypothetical protein
MNKTVVVNEWVFVFSHPAANQPGCLSVTVDNVDRRDRAFAQALAKVVEAWVNAGRRGRR